MIQTTQEPDNAMNNTDFATIARLAKAKFGLHLEPSKKSLIQARLTRRLRQLGLPDLGRYCDLLEQPDSTETDHLVSALTTNVTHFFREVHHFDHLETVVLPDLVETARKGGKIRLWSAGCSSGQEPYSMAASVLRICPEATKLDIRILATDIDPVILQRARDGQYLREEMASAPPDRQHMLFTNDQLKPELRQLVQFRSLNLMEKWPMNGRFDAIFCRNVAIYFDRETQQQLWQRFRSALTSDGILFIGHSERVSGPASQDLTPIGITMYQNSGTKQAGG